MRLPPPQAVFSPPYARPLLPAKPNPYYYYPGMPYRQREDELQQQPVINAPPNYYYPINPSSSGGGFWQSYTPQNYYSEPYSSYNATRKKSASLNKTWLQEQMDRTLAQKKEAQRKLAMKQLQQKSIADRAKLQVINTQKTSTKPATSSSKGTAASSRGGFGPSGSSHATSAAA
jgi:hypothetical protein